MYDHNQTWRTSMQDVARDAEDEFGEPFTITPAEQPNRGQAVYDPSKGKAARGIFRNKPVAVLKPSGAAGVDIGAIVETRVPQITLTFATIRGLGFPVERGTFVLRDEEGTLYQVRDLMADGVATVTFHLDQKGRWSTMSGLTTADADVPVAEGRRAMPRQRMFAPIPSARMPE